jgi:hypothetical protein
VSRVFGDPDRLEAFTAEASPAVGPARAAIGDYRDAVRALHLAGPNDLGTHLADLSPIVEAELDLLQELDRAPAAFAFALRHLDELRTGPWSRVRLTDLDRVEALATAWLHAPGAGDRELVDAARARLDTSLVLPWHEGGGWTADPTSPSWWAATTIGAADRTVQEVWKQWGVEVRGHYRGGRWVDAHGRWRPGWADRLNGRVGPASAWRTVRPWTRLAGRALPVVPGVQQYLGDRDDAGLTTGDRIARTTSAVALEGGAAAVGGSIGATKGFAAGAAIGTMIVPGVGTAVGGVVGAVVGGVVGGGIGAEAGRVAKDNVGGLVSAAGSGVDAVLDTVTDVGGSVVSSVRGWFARG